MTKILVVLDPLETAQSALERCKEISPDEDLQLHICMFLEQTSAVELELVQREKTAWLAEQIKPYVDLGYDITTNMISFTRLYETIIQTVLNIDADFVFKPIRRHSLNRKVVITSTDWNLIRLCPIPLLLVGDRKVMRGKPVVAAVDVCSHDANHEELNRVVMEQSARIARVLESEVNCVNAWSVNSAAMAVESVSSGSGSAELAHVIKTEHTRESLALCDKYNVPVEQIFVKKGTPESVINTTSRQIDAGIVVIGTVGAKRNERSFCWQYTAEAVLESITTDVMIVKQPAFECPLDFGL